MTADITILIVEDEPLIAADIEDQCKSLGYDVQEIAYNAGQALIALKAKKPSLVLLDINLSDSVDGIELAELLDREHKIPYVFITSYTDPKTLDRVSHLNHLGYIVKPFNAKQFAATLTLALSNLDAHKEASIQLPPGVKMSAREMDILLHMKDGRSLKWIGKKLFISVNTVKHHQKNIYIKCDVHNRVELFNKLLKK